MAGRFTLPEVLSGKPEDGYATRTLAADHPDRVARLAVAETPLPGVSPSPPLFASAHLNNALWHFAFNRLASVNDQLVTGREEIYFGWQFATKTAEPLPDHAVATTSAPSPPTAARCTPASRSTARSWDRRVLSRRW